MNNDIKMKLKNVLLTMHKEKYLEDFCEIIETDHSGKISSSTLKTLLDKYYQTPTKDDKALLLKEITNKIPGNIKLLELFEFFSFILNKKFTSPILAFYHLSYLIEKKLKMKTIDFINKVNLSLDSLININEFYKKISS